MQREKMFIIASNIDDSIKSVTPIYDISIFSNFIDFESMIETTPMKLGSIIISENELPFTNVSIARLLDVLSAPFLQLKGNCIYLISDNTSKEMVNSFIEDNGIENIVVYQGDLSSRYISEVVSGTARASDETETEVITYRMRASEYAMSQNIKKYESDEDKYMTDEDILSGIPDIEEPEVLVPAIDNISYIYYMVGKSSQERVLFTFLTAQYLSLSGKVVLVESDVQYHRLTDMVLKSNAKYQYIDLTEFINNPTDTLNKIKNSSYNIIVLGVKNKIIYNYDFIFDLLISNLSGFIDYFVRECDYSQTPYGSYYNIICADTVPDVIECCNSLLYDVDENKVIMIGIRTNKKTPVNISSREMADIVNILLEKNCLAAEVLEACGIDLKGDENIYDLFSIIARGNKIQT